MAIDLSGMSRKQLEKLRGDIDKTIERLDVDDRKKAMEAAEKAARAHGYSLSDLTGGKSRKTRKAGSAAPKYRNPENPTQTWTGRGRQPQWFKDALASGKSANDLAI